MGNAHGFSSPATQLQLEKFEQRATCVGRDSGSPTVDAPNSRLPAAVED